MTPGEAANVLAVWYQERESARPQHRALRSPTGALADQRTKALALAVEVLSAVQESVNTR